MMPFSVRAPAACSASRQRGAQGLEAGLQRIAPRRAFQHLLQGHRGIDLRGGGGGPGRRRGWVRARAASRREATATARHRARRSPAPRAPRRVRSRVSTWRAARAQHALRAGSRGLRPLRRAAAGLARMPFIVRVHGRAMAASLRPAAMPAARRCASAGRGRAGAERSCPAARRRRGLGAAADPGFWRAGTWRATFSSCRPDRSKHRMVKPLAAARPHRRGPIGAAASVRPLRSGRAEHRRTGRRQDGWRPRRPGRRAPCFRRQPPVEVASQPSPGGGGPMSRHSRLPGRAAQADMHVAVMPAPGPHAAQPGLAAMAAAEMRA